jgi:hypothetical protein
MDLVWTCACCGKKYDTLPFAYALEQPDAWHGVPEQQRPHRTTLDTDACTIDGREFYVRGCIVIPVIDHADSFVWGVWVSVSEKSFDRIGQLWDVEIRDHEPPFFGWLANNISIYPTTRNLKLNVVLNNAGQRPSLLLEPTDHPLAVEQRNGITLDRVKDIASQVLQHQTD